jgi:hypothetical protein
MWRKRFEGGTDVKKILLSAALLGLLAPLGAAQATVTQTFDFTIKDVKRDGRFTVVFNSRQHWDTTEPPLLTSNHLRLPRGAQIQKPFLNRRYYCDAEKLLVSLKATQTDASEKNRLFQDRVAKLTGTIKRIRKKLDKKALRNAETCARAQIGSGFVDVLVYLGESTTPVFADPLRARIFLYLGKKTQNDAVASFQIVSAPDENTPLVQQFRELITGNGRLSFALNILNEPTGEYGYKLVLPGSEIQTPAFSIRVVIPFVHVTTKGLTLTKKKTTCTKRRNGKCVKKKVKKTKVFWFNRPPCPSGHLSFEAFYAYKDGTTNTVTRQVPCPQFSA